VAKKTPSDLTQLQRRPEKNLAIWQSHGKESLILLQEQHDQVQVPRIKSSRKITWPLKLKKNKKATVKMLETRSMMESPKDIVKNQILCNQFLNM
jgi:hypothetical protein